MITELQILVAVFLDTLLGEPKRYHPLAGFGWYANKIEMLFYGSEALSPTQRQFRGVLAWLITVLPFVLLAGLLIQMHVALTMVLEALVLYFALGNQSLQQHAQAVMNALFRGELQQARYQIQMMVSRDTQQMQEEEISRATIESVLENGNDAIFGALFWFILFGAPGVLLFRLANTVDAMWGYKNHRYHSFGWFAARVDDVLNWAPARLTALSYAFIGKTKQAFVCWQTQANQWKGVNPGVVIATGAGALGITLGGVARYHGQQVSRPELGRGVKPSALDIKRSLQLVQKSLYIWLIVIFILGAIRSL